MNVLELLACFDWITPLLTVARSAARGDPLNVRSWAFFVPLESAWTGAELKALLRRHGIRMWGLMACRGEIFFLVSRDQAEWAEYVLLRHGVPLNHRVLSRRKVKHTQGTPASRDSARVGSGLLASLVGWLTDSK